MKSIASAKSIERQIVMLRGQRVIMDKDLAVLYGVSTGNLNKAVSRNKERFPADFMIQLTADEFKNLKFQIGTSSWGGTRKLPRAFTELGVAMLSSVLRSKHAIEVNIRIMRAFVNLREMIASHKDLAKRLDEMEQRYDSQFKVVFDAIRALIAEPAPKEKKIGFITERQADYRTAVAEGK